MLHSPLVIIIAQASRLPEFPLIKGRHPAEIGLFELESLDSLIFFQSLSKLESFRLNF